MAEEQASYCDGDYDDGTKREHGVICERGPLPGILVARPVGRSLFHHAACFMKRPACEAGPFLHSNAVVIIHRASPCGVVPVPGVVVAIFRRSLELTFGNAGAIAAKAQDSIRNFAAHLVDHDTFDRSDLGVVGAIDCGSFHLITADKGTCFSCFSNHCWSSSFLKNLQQATL